MTTITTKGRSHTNDYVSEFMIQYGDLSDYKEVDGSPKLSDANYDGFHEARTSFDQPIISQYIRTSGLVG